MLAKRWDHQPGGAPQYCATRVFAAKALAFSTFLVVTASLPTFIVEQQRMASNDVMAASPVEAQARKERLSLPRKRRSELSERRPAGVARIERGIGGRDRPRDA